MNDEENKEVETPAETPEPPKAEWQYQKGFKVNEQMKSVIEATMKMTQSEIARYRKKLSKLTYGV